MYGCSPPHWMRMSRAPVFSDHLASLSLEAYSVFGRSSKILTAFLEASFLAAASLAPASSAARTSSGESAWSLRVFPYRRPTCGGVGSGCFSRRPSSCDICAGLRVSITLWSGSLDRRARHISAIMFIPASRTLALE